eukprot:gene19551-26233_t
MTRLPARWSLWLHKKEDTTWGEDSYHRLGDLVNLVEFWPMFNAVAAFVSDAQFFLFKKGISPRYEDPANIGGGSISLKVDKKHLLSSLEEIMCKAAGEGLHPMLTGISIAPKGKHFIIKLWLSTCEFDMRDVMINNGIKNLYRYTQQYGDIQDNCDIAIVHDGDVMAIKPPSAQLSGLKFVDVKHLSDVKTLPRAQGNYWIATNEPINHSFHPGVAYSFPKRLKHHCMEIVYNGIASNLQKRIQQHLVRTGKGSHGMSGIWVDVLMEPYANISHTKLAWHPDKGGAVYCCEGARICNASQLCTSAKENKWLSSHKNVPIYFRNGIDVTDYKHKKFEWRIYYVACPNKFLNDIVEKLWRRSHGLPRLCTYSEAR